MSWEQFRELHSQVDPSTRNVDWYGLSQERIDLDFMGPMNWDDADPKTKFGILKTVLGMSNIPSGGKVVLGVSERNGTFDFVGLTEEEVASFEQTKVVSFFAANTEGRIKVSVNRVSVYGKRFVVLNVLPYEDIPVLSKHGEHGLRKGGLYVRTEAAQTKLVETSEELRRVLHNCLFRHGQSDDSAQ